MNDLEKVKKQYTQCKLLLGILGSVSTDEKTTLIKSNVSIEQALAMNEFVKTCEALGINHTITKQ